MTAMMEINIIVEATELWMAILTRVRTPKCQFASASVDALSGYGVARPARAAQHRLRVQALNYKCIWQNNNSEHERLADEVATNRHAAGNKLFRFKAKACKWTIGAKAIQ